MKEVTLDSNDPCLIETLTECRDRARSAMKEEQVQRRGRGGDAVVDEVEEENW